MPHWQRHHNKPIHLTNKYREREASIAQDCIGWTNFMLRQMTGESASAQQDYLDYLGRRKTGKRWLIAVMAKLLNISWDMWDHRNGVLHHKDHPLMQLASKAANWQIDKEYEQGPLNLDYGDQWLRRTSRQVKELSIEVKKTMATNGGTGKTTLRSHHFGEICNRILCIVTTPTEIQLRYLAPKHFAPHPA
jgi:hypothetical protein